MYLLDLVVLRLTDFPNNIVLMIMLVILLVGIKSILQTVLSYRLLRDKEKRNRKEQKKLKKMQKKCLRSGSTNNLVPVEDTFASELSVLPIVKEV